jgi:hypothetical protein
MKWKIFLENRPKIRFVEKGERKGENVYEALGQTDAAAISRFYSSTRKVVTL